MALSRRLAVSLGFAAFIGLSLIVAYLAGSFGDRCADWCASQGKQGRLVPAQPRAMIGDKGAPPTCECR